MNREKDDCLCPTGLPHDGCLTERSGFEARHFIAASVGGQYLLLLRCGVCGNGVVGNYQGVSVPGWVSGQSGMGDSELVEIWPKRLPIEAPQHLPENVSRYYMQGMDNIKRKNFDAAGTMFGKALDTGLKKLHPGGNGTLEKRIDRLPETLGITPAMKEWAHEIRHLRNDAAHEEDPFLPEEAIALQSFTELFLTYAFTLPGMLDARRAATNSS
jgi:hypothetical protein